jgi:uncharacterized protein (TIGR02265 family)
MLMGVVYQREVEISILIGCGLPTMLRERLMFTSVIEGIFVRGHEGQITPALKSELLAAGIDLDKLAPAYPVEVVGRACKTLTLALYPGLSEAEAFHQLGIASMRGYSQTLLGRALMHILTLGGVRRSLMRLHLSMRSGNNFLETSSTVLGDHHIELCFSDVHGMPSFYDGIIEEGARMAKAKSVRLQAVACAAPAHAVQVEWED